MKYMLYTNKIYKLYINILYMKHMIYILYMNIYHITYESYTIRR